MEIPNEEDQKYKITLHQLPQARFAQDSDCDLSQFDDIFISAPASDCQFFQKEVSIWVEVTGENIGQLHTIKLKSWDTDKNLLNRFSRRAPLNSFMTLYHGLRLKAKLLGS